jgi:L-lactate dehydrogenase complex protein LldF
VKRSPVEEYARHTSQQKTDSVRAATTKVTKARVDALPIAFEDSEFARTNAAEIKDRVLESLDLYLDQLQLKCIEHGIQVHFAGTAAEAVTKILEICREASPRGSVIAKAKSMATEEIHLNHHLEEAGYKPVETDLGEFVVQIDHDTPSHIVAPIIHKNRQEIAKSFEREGLGDYTEDPSELAMRARAYLRKQFQAAKIGISGVNFAIAETGRIVLVENEGNNRLSTTAPEVHIALMGIEKILPSESDLPLFLKLLAASATGQYLPTYVHMISGPRRSDEVDGPREVHLVLLDNGRRKILNGKYRKILRCIRCGACQNVCPVFRQGSGHAYGHVYSGPIGAVLAPNLEGIDKLGYLAKASSLCGACEEVCPVKIPIPHMLLELRDEAKRSGAVEDPANWNHFAFGAKRSGLWKVGLKLLPMASNIAPHPMKSGWSEFHDLPKRRGEEFRSWWKSHTSEASTPNLASAIKHIHERPVLRSTLTTDPWTQFGARIAELGGRLIDLADLDLSDKLCYLDCDVAAAFPNLKIGSVTQDVWEAEVGITFAECAIVESGSIVASIGNQRSRLASLTPPVHVALVREVVRTVEEGIPRAKATTSVITTGTSRTADIEGILVRGVHGPKELIAVRLP